jgi:hypothetical protein
MRFSPGCSCCGGAPAPDCTDCCDPAPPATLYATITGIVPSSSGACGCFFDGETVELTYEGGTTCVWTYVEFGAPLCSVGTDRICWRTVSLTCVGGQWNLAVSWCRRTFTTGDCPVVTICNALGESDVGFQQNGGTFLCDPFEVAFDAVTTSIGLDNPTAACGDMANYVVTVTE